MFKKKFITQILVMSLVLFFGVNTYACTGLIIGKKLTKDGSAIFARTDDLKRNHNINLVRYKKGTYKEGEKFIDKADGFEYIFPHDSYEYIAAPYATLIDEDGIYDESGFNEYGVAASMTVTAKHNDKIKKVDPYVKKGITEAGMTTVALATAKTAKDGIKLIADIIDEKGSGEGSNIVIADKNELWYMEIYSGHQYVAIKYPDDKFSVTPNTYWLGTVDLDDKENVIHSKNIEKVAKEADSYIVQNGKFHLAKSYAPEMAERNRSRVWSGIHAIDPQSKIEYDADEFPFLNTLTDKNRKIPLEDVMKFQRNRLEGTKYIAADEYFDSPLKKYPIGNMFMEQAHIIQIKDDFPEKAPGVMWFAMGNPLNSPYLPYFANVKDFDKSLQVKSAEYDPNSYSLVVGKINDIVDKNRKLLEKTVRKKISAMEKILIEKEQKIEDEFLELYKEDPKRTDIFATELSLENGKDAFKLLKEILNDLEKNYTFRNLELKIDDKDYTIKKNDKIENKKFDVAPFISENRTMLPMRSITDALGGKVNYNDKTRTAIFDIDGNKIEFNIDKDYFVINGKDFKMDAKPINKDGRIFISISNFGKAIGLSEGKLKGRTEPNIKWDEKNKRVVIDTVNKF